MVLKKIDNKRTQKRAEDALKESEKRYRSLFENMLDGYAYCKMLYDNRDRPVDFVYLNVNIAFERLTGLKNVVGKKVTEVIPGIKESHPELFEIYGRVALTGNTEKFDIEFKPLSVWLAISVYSTECGYFTAVFDNITGRKRAEQALSRNEEKYRLLFANMAEGFALYELLYDDTGKPVDWRVLEVNDAYSRHTGVSREQIVGRCMSELFPAVISEYLSRFAQVVATQKSDEFETYAKSVDRYQHVVCFPAGTNRFANTITDISGRKRAEDALKQANKELAVVNKELEGFSYSVSHDLRTPLRSIEGFTAAILEESAGTLSGTSVDYFQRVLSASRRMSQLIDAMLNLARLTKSELREKTVDLSDLAEAIARELQKKDPTRRVRFVIAKGVKAKGDMDMLQTVLENLLDNAWKFSGKHPSATIEFGAAQKEGKTAYFVRDDGAGFMMHYADKLFQPFQRLHTPVEFPGIGIGLAMVKRIINRHGGKIWAESAPEQGATFYFTLD
jgi:PAS domain S-box-containing protein